LEADDRVPEAQSAAEEKEGAEGDLQQQQVGGGDTGAREDGSADSDGPADRADPVDTKKDAEDDLWRRQLGSGESPELTIARVRQANMDADVEAGRHRDALEAYNRVSGPRQATPLSSVVVAAPAFVVVTDP